jgi:hypothetical protein
MLGDASITLVLGTCVSRPHRHMFLTDFEYKTTDALKDSWSITRLPRQLLVTRWVPRLSAKQKLHSNHHHQLSHHHRLSSVHWTTTVT